MHEPRPDLPVAEFGVQRLYDSVDLINRVGDRSQRQLCVMSLVALLAGEPHSDRPQCACPVIAAYAVKLNDALDDDVRQRLKPYAPRIIGTRNGHAAERARFLVAAILRDIAPRLFAPDTPDTARHAAALQLRPDESPEVAARRLAGALRRAVADGALTRGRCSDLRYLLRAFGRESPELVASAAAVLLANSARLADHPAQTRWYWDYATSLLDRACDIGPSATRSTADIGQMSQRAAARLQIGALKSSLGHSGDGGLRAFLRSLVA